MSEDDLSIQGTLAETTVPDLFRSLVRSSETGIVSLDAVGRNDVIYFQEGRIIAAMSSDPDMGLAEILLRSGDIDLQQYNNAMERVVVARRIGAVLVELGYLDPDELVPAVERQANSIVLNAMAYRTGGYTVEFTSNLPEGIIALPLSTERLILDGVRRIEYWSLIFRGIGRLDRMLEAVPGAEMRSYSLELNDDESHILSFFTEPQTVESVCARSYLSNFLTCRTLWGMLAVNLLQDNAEADAIDEKRAAQQNEYELEAEIERYNTVFEKVFSRAVADGLAEKGLPGTLFRVAMREFDRYAEAKENGRFYSSFAFELARTLVFPEIREAISKRFGDRIRTFVSGGAPLEPKIATFFDLLGFEILEIWQALEIGPQMLGAERPLEVAPAYRLRVVLRRTGSVSAWAISTWASASAPSGPTAIAHRLGRTTRDTRLHVGPINAGARCRMLDRGSSPAEPGRSPMQALQRRTSQLGSSVAGAFRRYGRPQTRNPSTKVGAS